jgi:hypothetical protein
MNRPGWLDNWFMPEPSALTNEAHREILLIVYRLLARAGDWPGFEEVDYEVDRSGLGDAWTLVQQLPHNFITGTDLRTPPSPRQQLGLTIAGMAAAGEHIDSAATDFRAFCESVMLAVELAERTSPPEAPTLQAAEIHRRVELPATDRSGVLSRLGRQWSINGQLWSQLHRAGDSWSATLNRKGLRAYRGANDKVTFLNAEDRRLLELAQSDAMRRPQSEAPSLVGEHRQEGSGDVPAWFALLPDNFASQIRSRLMTGHPEDAFVQGWKTLSNTLSATSGLPLDGYDLVNQSFRSVDVSAMSAAERNLLQGYFDVMRGLARLRNVHAHPGASALTDLEVAAFILMLGACSDWVLSRGTIGSPTSAT